jgi:hypothetical protein
MTDFVANNRSVNDLHVQPPELRPKPYISHMAIKEPETRLAGTDAPVIVVPHDSA